MDDTLFVGFNLFMFLIMDHRLYSEDQHRPASSHNCGSLSLIPIELSLVDNIVVIHRSVILETYGKLHSLDPHLRCAPLIHHVVPLRITLSMVSPSQSLRW
jgi:hypothetical protein